jgi:hypothetical protein
VRKSQHPLIVLVLYYAIVFSAFALFFEILEHLVLGGVHDKGPAAVLSEMLQQGWPHFIAMTLIVFFAFLPFFAFRETGRAIGEGKLYDLFFKRRSEVISKVKEEQMMIQ